MAKLRWKEWEHPRNPDTGEFVESAGQEWADRYYGKLGNNPGAEVDNRVRSERYDAGFHYNDPEDEEEEVDIWDEDAISSDDGPDLSVVKRVSGDIELSIRHDDDTVTPLMTLTEQEARNLDRELDFLDTLVQLGDFRDDYAKGSIDNNGLVIALQAGRHRVVGLTPEGEFRILSTFPMSATGIALDQDMVRELSRSLAKFASWGELEYDDEDGEE